MGIKINYRHSLSLVFTLFFFLITPLTISLSLFTLLSIQNLKLLNTKDKNYQQYNSQIFAALPDKSPSTSAKLISSDARGDIIKNYLTEYNSPLVPFSYYIVNVADEFDVDFRLITAIARQESNLCRYVPENTYNCWGWGIHSRGTLAFSSFEEGIRTVTEGLKRDYLSKGYNNPDEIMKKYTPLSDGSWANAVNQFLLEME
jgi:hypothetical protein